MPRAVVAWMAVVVPPMNAAFQVVNLFAGLQPDGDGPPGRHPAQRFHATLGKAVRSEVGGEANPIDASSLVRAPANA
jgi:hypothetical protein